MKSLPKLQSLKFLKYFLWVGLFLVVAGLTAGMVSAQWGIVPLTMIGLGLLAWLLWLGSQGEGLTRFWGRRSTQEGTNALVATVAAIAIFLLINFLGMRYNTRWDLTENQAFTLAPQTQQVVRELKQPTRLVIFAPTLTPADKQLLDNYRRFNPNLTYESIDPDVQPGIAQEFGAQLGDVFVEQGDRRRQVPTLPQGDRLSEPALTNALAQLAITTQPKIYFVQGHGERPLEAGQGGLGQAKSGLSQESFDPQPLNLAETPKVPEDAAVVVLAGPQRALLQEEVEALKEFQQRRSGLMVMVDPQINAGLDELLNPWGVSFGDRVLVDPDAGREAAITIVTKYGPHPITEKLGNGVSFYLLARPLLITNTAGVQATPLLLTNDRTEGHRIGEDGQLVFDPAQDPKGELTVGAAFSRPAGEGEARLVTIGNSAFVTDGLIDQQLNRDVFLNAIAWLSQDEGRTSVDVRPKDPTNRRISLTEQQQLFLSLGALAFLPMVGVMMAIGLWWTRR